MKTWQEALADKGLMEKSVAADFEKRFVAFYLSEGTYLGRGRSCSGSLRAVASGCCA